MGRKLTGGVLWAALMLQVVGCGGGVAPGTGPDITRPAQQFMVQGDVTVLVSPADDRLVVTNLNQQTVGVVIRDATDNGVLIFSSPRITNGNQATQDKANLTPRQATVTVYVYTDSGLSVLESITTAFGVDFESHLQQSWVQAKYQTTIDIK